MRRHLTLLLVLLAACSGTDTDSTSTEAPTTAPTTAVESTTTVASTTTAAPTTTTSAPTTTTTTVPGPVQLAFDTRDGVAFLEVEKGEDVELTVTSDASDEVHLHGYDIKADVTPSQAAVIVFMADTPGVFEIELEGSGRRIAQLQVTG